MTRAEIIAYNAGVRDVLALARRSAAMIETKGTRPLHLGFAVEALRALADEAEALIRTVPPEPRERP